MAVQATALRSVDHWQHAKGRDPLAYRIEDGIREDGATIRPADAGAQCSRCGHTSKGRARWMRLPDGSWLCIADAIETGRLVAMTDGGVRP